MQTYVDNLAAWTEVKTMEYLSLRGIVCSGYDENVFSIDMI